MELRVLELGSGVSAAYAAKLLGDHGADVLKVETPEGDQTRCRGPFANGAVDAEKGGTFLALNVNKRGVCIDLDSVAGRRRLAALIAWADILVHNYAPRRARLVLSQRWRHPCSVTSGVLRCAGGHRASASTTTSPSMLRARANRPAASRACRWPAFEWWISLGSGRARSGR